MAPPLHNYASYLGVADLTDAAVRADRRIEGRDVIEHALNQLNGMTSHRLEQLIARARGILADPARAEAWSDEGLSDPAGTSGHSSGHSFASTTPNGCGAAAGSPTPSPY